MHVADKIGIKALHAGNGDAGKWHIASNVGISWVAALWQNRRPVYAKYDGGTGKVALKINAMRCQAYARAFLRHLLAFIV